MRNESKPTPAAANVRTNIAGVDFQVLVCDVSGFSVELETFDRNSTERWELIAYQTNINVAEEKNGSMK